MGHKKKNSFALTFAISVTGVCLLITAFTTDHWIRSTPRQNITAGESLSNETKGSPTKYTGNITFGLFRGYRTLDYGTGGRDSPINVVCSGAKGVCTWSNQTNSSLRSVDLQHFVAYRDAVNVSVKLDLINYGLFDFGLWVTTIVMLSMSIVWGLVSIGFTAFNILGKPIETITGPTSLYLWNGLAFTFSLIGVLVFVGLFVKDLSKNILPPYDVEIGWQSQDLTWLDYSFYLVVGAAAAFLFNNIVLMMSGQELMCSYSRAAEKELDNGMILY